MKSPITKPLSRTRAGSHCSEPGRRWRFLALALSFLAAALTLAYGYHPAHAGGHAAEPSPDVICPMSAVYTSQPCYPRIFQSTSDEIYTKVLDGQEVPAGFDVRLDMQTGERWAKLPRRPRQNTPPRPVADMALVPGQQVHDDDDGPPAANTRRQQSAPSGVQFRRQDARQPGQQDFVPYQRPSGSKRRVSAADSQSLQDLMAALAGRDEPRTGGAGILSPAQWDTLDELTHQVDHGLDFLVRFSQDPVFGEIADRLSQQPSKDAVMFYRVIGNSLQNNDKAIKHVEHTIPDLSAHLIECINHNTRRLGPQAREVATQLAKSCLYTLGSLVRGSKSLAAEFLVEFQGQALLRKWAREVPDMEAKCRALSEDLGE